MNEDVFVSPLPALMETMDSEVQEITEQIHRLLLQPVHNTSSSGYGSVESNDHLAASQVMTSEGSPSRTHIEEEGESSWAKPVSTLSVTLFSLSYHSLSLSLLPLSPSL